MRNKFSFAVLCKTEEQFKKVVNSNHVNNTIFSYKNDYFQWYSVTLKLTLGYLNENDYGYKFRNKFRNKKGGKHDVNGYRKALFENDHCVVIIFQVNELGKIYEWLWGEYIKKDWTKIQELYEIKHFIGFDEFLNLLNKLSSKDEVTEKLIASCGKPKKVLTKYIKEVNENVTADNINIAKLLKNCPKGMGLDCTMWKNITFEEVSTIKGFDDKEMVQIIVSTHYADGTKRQIVLTEFGTYTYDETAKCVIFPKGKTTWEGFQKTLKNRDRMGHKKDDTIEIKDNSHLKQYLNQKIISEEIRP